jgi:hypothetical protein
MASLNGRVIVYGFNGLGKRARTNWFSKVGSYWSHGHWNLDIQWFESFHGYGLGLFQILHYL